MSTDDAADKPKVRVPMTISDEPSDIGVPDIVTGAPFGERVALPTRKPAGFGVKIVPATVKTGSEERERKGIVLVPVTNPEAPRDTGIPDPVTTGLFDRRLEPPLRNPVGFAVKDWLATENTKEGGFDGKGTVCVPTTIFDDPRDTGVPDIVIISTGVIKVPATEKPVGFGAMNSI